MNNLWDANHPRNFWQCQPDLSDELWSKATACAIPLLELSHLQTDIESILVQTLGEAQFGADHWRMGLNRRIYYLFKPVLPRTLTRFLRQRLQKRHALDFELGWPVEERYPRFQFGVLKKLLELSGKQTIQFYPIWPNKARYAFILTHDIETKTGLEFVRNVADLEEDIGFRSSFNFVPERYRLDLNLIDELRSRGFEIGIHGLKHDGKLFNSRVEFERRAAKINHYLKEYGAVGFRSPLTHRNPEWMQALDIDYDLSFFDTDPFEPISGGTTSIWPFFIGNFVELPYTLAQDYTLTAVLGETTPRLWLEKVDFTEKYHGMALVNSHPDYLQDAANWKLYTEFLSTMKQRTGYWNALPHEVASWWRKRADVRFSSPSDQENLVSVTIDNGQLEFGRLPVST